MASYLQSLRGLPVLGCTQCQHGVLIHQLDRHLSREPHKIPKPERNKIVNEVSTQWSDQLLCDEWQCKDFELPSANIPAIPHLERHSDGYQCTFRIANGSVCQRIFGGQKDIQGHCRNIHQWKNPRPKHRPTKAEKERIEQEERPWKKVRYYQRIFTQGPMSQYFEVDADIEPEVPAMPEATLSPTEKKKREAWEQIQQRQKNQMEEHEPIQPEDKFDANPWLRRTRWTNHLGGFSMDTLVPWIQMPSKTEPVLQSICDSIDRTTRYAQQTMSKEVNIFVLFEINRKDRGKDVAKPFEARMEDDSFQRYVRAWQQIVCYLYRTHQIPRRRRPRYRFTPAQQTAFQELIRLAEITDSEDHLREDEIDEDEGEEDEGDDDEEDGESDPSDDETSEDDPSEVEEDNDDGFDGSTLIPSDPWSPPTVRKKAKASPPQKTKKMMCEMDRQCLRFCVALLDQQLQGHEYNSAIISGLAMLGIDCEDEKWRNAENYTPILSAVIKIARLFVVQQAYIDVHFQPHSINETTQIMETTEQEIRDKAASMDVYEPVQTMVERFMITGRPTPMYWMYTTRTYGLKIRYTTSAAGAIDWVDDEVRYQNVAFTMRQFRGWIHGLTGECQRILTQELLMIPDENDPDQITPVIPWDSIYDNPSESKPGWSFQDDIRNQFPVDGSRWLYDRMFDNESIRQEFMYSGERIRWRRDRFKRYLRQVTAFKEKLAIVIHTSGGQPARAPELLSIRHRNTVNGGRRNIFVENELMVYVTTYHKGYSISGNTKIIHRYLPREVGSLLMYYLWFVIPFQRLLETAVYGEAVDSPYLWSQGAPGSQDSKWTSERIRYLIQRESEIGLGQKLNISSYRQIAIAITRKYLIKDPFINDREDEDGVDDDDPHGSMPDSAFDLQSGHGSHVAGMIYARWTMEAPQEVASMRERFRQVSRAWHMLLEFPSELATIQAMTKKRKAVTDQPEGIAGEFQRWKKVRSMDPYPVLEQIVGQPNAQFRGQQGNVIQAITKGQSPICAVMGTSEGKSLLFMLPAMCSAMCSITGQEGVTIVVVPLITLRQDMKERCDRLRISCVEWNSRRPEEASIVLVTPESAVSKTFQSFMMRLKARNRFDRIVIDECHVVLSSKDGFRPKLQRLGELFINTTQFVLLTATLPPQEEHRFWEIMRIPAGEVVMFRSPTSRKNIRYQVVAYDGTDEKAVQFIRAKIQQHAAPGKIVVYSNRVDRVERLAEMLDCPSIHANEEDKAEYFREFRQGEHRVVVATNALGMGVDIPDIRCVIHVDRPRTLLDYGQESGRAGRDRKASEGIIMRMVRGPAPGVVPNPAAEKIEQFMEGDHCRRVVLDQYMDGRQDRGGCEEGEEPCDVCHGRRGGVFEDSAGAEDENPQDEADRIEFQRQQRERQWLRERVLRIKSQEAIDVEDLAAQLEEWEGRCPLCYVRGKPAQGHGLMTCESEGAEEVQEVYQHMKKGVRWEKYSCCFQCGVPQAICDRWERIPDEWGWRQVRPSRCQFPEVIMAAVATIIVEERARLGWTVMEWIRADGIDDQVDQAVYQWFGQRIVWGDIEATRMIQVFYRLTTRMVRRVSNSRPGSRGMVSVQAFVRGK